MAAHAIRIPPARRRRRWPLRLLGLLATAAFLGSGVAIALMVMPKDKAATSTTPPPAKAKPAPHGKAGMTKAQKRARHAAVAVLAGEGYEPVRLADWRPRASLKVLIGRDDAGAMRAFFFADGKFVGHDDPTTSNHLWVAKAGRREVTLAYRLSTGSTEKVGFRWQNGDLAPSGPIPPSTVR
jgi:hypothetical protein